MEKALSRGSCVGVVGLGASAGGLEALQQFFSNLPTDSGLAYVVIQHLSPDYKSLMVELLSKSTSLKVQRIEDEMIPEGNNVYLIPPKKNVVLNDGRLRLTDLEHSHGLNLPIDVFFRSLAEDRAERAIGIVLSGQGVTAPAAFARSRKRAVWSWCRIARAQSSMACRRVRLPPVWRTTFCRRIRCRKSC